MAFAWRSRGHRILDDAALGKKPHFELVVQNVSEKEIHFLASDEAPNPRELNFLADNRTVAVSPTRIRPRLSGISSRATAACYGCSQKKDAMMTERP